MMSVFSGWNRHPSIGHVELGDMQLLRKKVVFYANVVKNLLQFKH